VRLVVDAQLPPALAQWLVTRGHDAVHVFDPDYARVPDSVIGLCEGDGFGTIRHLDSTRQRPPSGTPPSTGAPLGTGDRGV
jgi:hypothetical protein